MRVGAVNSDHDESINLDQSQVDELSSAYALIQAAAAVEDKWDLHVENYRELELAWLETSLNDSIFSVGDIAHIYGVNRTIVRRLLNMLSSALLYKDHLKSSVSRELSFCEAETRSTLAEMEKKQTSVIIDALRNFLQHRDIPLGITLRTERTRPVADSNILYMTQVDMLIKKMLEDHRLPDRVMKLLRAEKAPRKPLNKLVREYMELLWDVHDQFRKATFAQIQGATATVMSTIEQIDMIDPRFRASKDKLFMVIDDLSGRSPDQVRIFSNSAMLNREHLVSKHRSLRGLRRRIVIADIPSN
jgi:hypothetical protein